jgi:hypothetical protein
MRHVFVFLRTFITTSIVLLGLLSAAPARGEQFFQKTSTWYAEIPEDPVLHPDSETMIANWVSKSEDFLVACRNEWGHPLVYAAADTPLVEVEMDNPDGGCGSNAIANGWNMVPIPDGTLPAGNEASCAGEYRDGHLHVVSHDGRWIWEFFGARHCPAENWKTGCVRKRARREGETEVGVWDGSGVGCPYDTMGDVTACSGSASIHGMMLRTELQSGGVIDHALSFVLGNDMSYEGPLGWVTADTPCCDVTDYSADNPDWPRDGSPEGMFIGQRIQLDPAVDCGSIFSDEAKRKICVALQAYGMILTDWTGPGGNYVWLEPREDNCWEGVLPDILLSDIPKERFRVIAAVCDDCAACPNCVEESEDEDGPEEAGEGPPEEAAEADLEAPETGPDPGDGSAVDGDEGGLEEEGGGAGGGCGCVLAGGDH